MYEFPCRPRARAVPVSDGVQQAGDRRPLTRCISTQAVGLQRLGCGVRTWLLVPRLVTSFGMVAGFVFCVLCWYGCGAGVEIQTGKAEKVGQGLRVVVEFGEKTAERLGRGNSFTNHGHGHDSQSEALGPVNPRW